MATDMHILVANEITTPKKPKIAVITRCGMRTRFSMKVMNIYHEMFAKMIKTAILHQFKDNYRQGKLQQQKIMW